MRSIAIGPPKRALREKKGKKQEIPMGGGCTTARAQRHPEGTTKGVFNVFSGWWLNQPISKICSSNWVHLPQVGVEIENI